VIVIERPEKPPSFGPGRAQGNRLTIQSDGLIDFVGFATLCGGGDRIKIL
jgi:hypothetical protein